MKLTAISQASKLAVSLPAIGGDKELAKDVQERLAAIGLLDPPADSQFGPVSHWALSVFLKAVGFQGKTALDAEVANALLSQASEQVFPLKRQPESPAGLIADAMLRQGYWLCRHPDAVNVVYVEGMGDNGQQNDNRPNQFNDLRLVLKLDSKGVVSIVGKWEATSEPGTYYTKIRRLDAKGAARIAFGQYKAWSVGQHARSKSTSHEALVQTAAIRIHRDDDEDFQRKDDNVYAGLFAINQHWGYDNPRSDIGTASAGCLVGRTREGHREFMAMCKADPRYKANHSYRFMTAVLSAAEVASSQA